VGLINNVTYNKKIKFKSDFIEIQTKDKLIDIILRNIKKVDNKLINKEITHLNFKLKSFGFT
jgi:hypothetical protein